MGEIRVEIDRKLHGLKLPSKKNGSLFFENDHQRMTFKYLTNSYE